MAAEDYTAGAVKHDPDTGAVAVRTVFPDIESLADRQWGVMTTANGGHYTTYEKVKHWPDMTSDGSDPDPDEIEGS